MKVEEVMTHDVITTSPGTAIHEAARLMVNHTVSGLPVVDDAGKLVGVISEGDLILRQKHRERLSWWRLFFEDGERLAREYQKAVGTTVGEVMSTAVISASPDLPIESAAVILDRHRIRRLPVVADGRVVGIVSRGDLVKALSTAPAPTAATASDAALMSEMKARLDREPWVSSRAIVVQAREGVLALWGLVSSETERSAIGTMARTVPGVRGIEDHLVVQADIPYWYGAV
ncbi:MAG: CBS domain-containing protein [Candidatus Rokubacteria bacterium]|nr:CBS domain-containing protein [Candidatus Rokubacteria bacterium]